MYTKHPIQGVFSSRIHTPSLLSFSLRQLTTMRKASCDHSHHHHHEINKGAWSKQEDQKLVDHIRKHGEGGWRDLPKAAGLLRCSKSCRLRWMNHLKQTAKRGNFGDDEEDLIIKLHALLGDRWSLIAGRLPGRTEEEVKNYWNSHIKKKLVDMGIDPNNHRVSCTYSRPHNSASAGKSRVTSPEKQRIESDGEVSDAGSSNVR